MRHPHFFIARLIRARPRLFLSGLAGVLTVVGIADLLPSQQITRWIIGWNVGVCLYLVLSGVMMVRSTDDQIRRRARQQDEGRWMILMLLIIAVVASLAAIVAELAVAKDMAHAEKYAHIGLAAFTIFTSWVFTHLIFAQHYAHDYYVALTNRRPAGLAFPDGEGRDDTEPDYGDFLYFSMVIGTSGQTADVSVTSKPMRRLALLHCVLAFLFNTTVLALTINIAASLF